MPRSPEDVALDNRRENLQWRLDQHRDVVRAHDTVHPDRSDCGGVGGCRLLSTEVEVEREIAEGITELASLGIRVEVTLVRQ